MESAFLEKWFRNLNLPPIASQGARVWQDSHQCQFVVIGIIRKQNKGRTFPAMPISTIQISPRLASAMICCFTL
jgi:hypothetical protein